jgi:condensin complex subunit 2
MERSRASQAELGRSLLAQDSSGSSNDTGQPRDSLGLGRNDFEPDDFGGGTDFDEDIGNAGFDNFHDGDHRFSSASFQAVSSLDGRRISQDGTTLKEPTQPTLSQATILLDAIASGTIVTSQSSNPYEFFNSQALANLSSGNLWAGADHWKKIPKTSRASVVKNKNTRSATASEASKIKKGKKAKSSSSTNRQVLVDITNPVHNLQELMKKNHKTKRGGSSTNHRWTKAMQTKYSNVNNLLPTDIGLDVKELTTLFFRPKTNLADIFVEKHSKIVSCQKAVGFGGAVTWGSDNDGYSEDEDGGIGFDFGGDAEDIQDFVVPELEGVRKVEKIKVGYATVAKKVDVKRLKQDLWEELERTFLKQGRLLAEKILKVDSLEIEMMSGNVQSTDRSLSQDDTEQVPISFQDTVRHMQTSQSQADVTLPFYFICVLHLCNEKGLSLESCGLNDFIIHSS